MTGPTSTDTVAVPTPRIKKRSGPSLVWLIPLITAIIGGWLVFKTLAEQGPRITITFETAEGIEAGKTKIKYKEVEIGVVDSVAFSDNFSNIILKADIGKEAESFLRRDTRFWVVKPRLSLHGVSGLSTLVSGAYLEIEPGKGASWRDFTGLDAPPVVKADVAGKKIVLLAGKLGSIGIRSPIYYQGILAGEVLGHELGNDRKSVFIHAFIKAPYDELVKSNSRFWNVSGMDVSVGSDGVNLRTESVQSMLFGGIAFDTPDSLEQIKEDEEGLVFTLYDDFKSIAEHSFTRRIKFVLFFEGSVRGLNIGAPVEFKGIKVGSVVDVRLEFDSRETTFRIPVLIEIEPERVIERGDGETSSPYRTLKTLVDHGLRARLQTGSLLTGQLFVELDMHPDTPIRLVYEGETFPELPTIPASMEEITSSVRGFLSKLEKVDVAAIGEELLGALQGANMLANAPELQGAIQGAHKLINAPELQGAVGDLKVSLAAFKSILRKVDQRVEPLAVTVEKAIGSGHRTLEQAQNTLGLLDEVLKPDTPLQFRLIQMTEELAEAARSIRILVDLLERNPESLIFGKNPPGGKK